MKKYLEAFGKFFVICLIVALLVGFGYAIYKDNQYWKQYLYDYEAAPTEQIIEVFRIDKNDDDYWIAVDQQEVRYATRTMLFVEDEEGLDGIYVLLEKKEQMNRVQFFLQVFGPYKKDDVRHIYRVSLLVGTNEGA